MLSDYVLSAMLIPIFYRVSIFVFFSNNNVIFVNCIFVGIILDSYFYFVNLDFPYCISYKVGSFPLVQVDTKHRWLTFNHNKKVNSLASKLRALLGNEATRQQRILYNSSWDMKESHHCKNRTLGKSSESCYENVRWLQVFLLSYASAGDHIHLLLNHFST